MNVVCFCWFDPSMHLAVIYFPKIGLATILFLCTSTGMYGYCSTMQYAPMYTYCNAGEDAIGMFRKIPAKIAICLTNPLSIYFRMIILYNIIL